MVSCLILRQDALVTHSELREILIFGVAFATEEQIVHGLLVGVLFKHGMLYHFLLLIGPIVCRA